MRASRSLPGGGKWPRSGEVACQPCGQVCGECVQRQPIRQCLDVAIELAGQHRLGVAAQSLLGLTAHRLQKDLNLLELIPQIDGAVEGIALVEAFYLFQALPQGQTNQQDDQCQQQQGQA